MRRTDPLIVGGGPAGAAVAITLARAGRRPLLIERNREPRDVVCGAFLGWDAIAALDRLGVDIWALGARPIEHVRLIAGTVRIERRLPARAAGLSRRTLDAALLRHAAGLGTAVERGMAARLRRDDRVHTADGATLEGDTTFLATGKHELRGVARITDRPRSIGLRTALGHAPDLAGCVELHLLDGGYAGLLLQEDGCSNLCLSVTAARMARAGSRERLLHQIAAESPSLGERFSHAGSDWSAVAGVPYGWRAADTGPGLFRVGDQAAVIASLAGDGIAIALASGRAAAEAWLRGGGAAAQRYQHDFFRRAFRPLAVAEALRRTAERPCGAAALLRGPAQLPGLLRLAALATRIGA